MGRIRSALDDYRDELHDDLVGARRSRDDDRDDGDERQSRKLDGRTRDGRLMRDTRNALLREFPRADELRLREATTISIAIERIRPQVMAGDQSTIATLAKLSNRLQCLRRELAQAAARAVNQKTREAEHA